MLWIPWCKSTGRRWKRFCCIYKCTYSLKRDETRYESLCANSIGSDQNRENKQLWCEVICFVKAEIETLNKVTKQNYFFLTTTKTKMPVHKPKCISWETPPSWHFRLTKTYFVFWVNKCSHTRWQIWQNVVYYELIKLR